MSDARPPFPDPEYERIALELLAQPRDVLGDFIEALRDPVDKGRARETVRMRHEFLHHAQRAITPMENPCDAMRSAAWLAKNAQEVTYRWWALVQAATRWSMFQAHPIRVTIPT